MSTDEQDREWSDWHDSVHEDPYIEQRDCEQCQVLLADQRYLAEQSVRAHLEMNPRTLRRDHNCTHYTGQNTECGDPAYDRLDGEWLCDHHVKIRRGQIVLASLLEALDQEVGA